MIETAKESLITYGEGISAELKKIFETKKFKGVQLKGRLSSLSYTAFGEESLETLVKHFRKRFTAGESEIIDQFHHLKSVLYTRYGKDLWSLSWEEDNNATADQGVSSILCLVDLVLSLPPTSDFNERAFSHMKLIKSDRRARLATETLTDIMVVKSESPAVENFNPNEAISSWLATQSGRSRRPDFSRVKKDCRNAEEKQQKQIVETEREQDETAREHEREGIVEEQREEREKEQERDGIETDQRQDQERGDTEIEREEEEKEEELYKSDESDCEQDYTKNDKNMAEYEIENEYE